MAEAAKDRPPYVAFEYRSVEDRNATIEAGHYVGKDVAYAIITPQGSKDRIERVATDWFSSMEQMVAEERFPAEWLRAYRSVFKEWSEGNGIPESGTPILTWPAVNKSQAQAILFANIRTVEDLAQANEAAVAAIGIGARSLVQRAKDWLSAAKDTGQLAERLSALEAAKEGDALTIESQAATIAALKAQVAALENKGK